MSCGPSPSRRDVLRGGHGPLLDVFVLDMKAYRDPNGPNRYTEPRGGILGFRQLDWLQRNLAASRATWKVIAAERTPISGFQFFGEVAIDGASRVMTVRLRDLSGRALHTVELDPDSEG